MAWHSPPFCRLVPCSSERFWQFCWRCYGWRYPHIWSGRGVFIHPHPEHTLLVQLLLVYFGLPLLGFRLSAVGASLLTLSVNLGAYAVEIIRAGIESITRGQVEAGLALALVSRRVLRLVVLPQAIANVWPALSAQYVHTLLGSSLCSVVSVVELSGAAALIDEVTFRSMETYLIVSVIYLALSWSLRVSLQAIGVRLFRSRRVALA